MTKTITGSLGIDLDITETNDGLTTGTITRRVKVDDAIKSIDLADSDIIVGAYGSVGTTPFDVDMNDLDDDSGSGYTLSVDRDQNVDLTTLKTVVIHNTHASNNLKFINASANGFLTWEGVDNFITIPAGASITLTFSTALTLSTSGKFALEGSAADTSYELYFVGT